MIMNDKIRVGLQIRNQKVRWDFEEVLSPFNELSLQEFAPDKSYDLLILEIGEDLEKDFERVQSIQNSGLVQDIFLTSSRLEPELLIRALRAGARATSTRCRCSARTRARGLRARENRRPGSPFRIGARTLGA